MLTRLHYYRHKHEFVGKYYKFIGNNNGKMKCTHILISGRVQGVLFRANTKKQADLIGVKGWVRNLESNKVESLAEGTEHQIKKFIEYCKHGPIGANVECIEIEEQEYKCEFKGFSIRY